ncbi:class I SAM-dependent methyltransferase [Reyranella massiliensis]|uniref:class I SAM-dependent methyltransferase n=1 Tax=Reyranella massiliensis TaxID=445220 RepID=UPI0002F3C42F|nr:methyltransferase domain-containing protein [Reyranella massiliensis]
MLDTVRAAIQAKFETLSTIGRARAAAAAKAGGDWSIYDRREDNGMFTSQVSFLRGLPSGARILDVGCGNNAPFRVKDIRPDCYYVGLDVGDYNQDRPMAANEYVLVSPEEFAGKIATLGQFEGVISTHNLEHCNDRGATLAAMLGAVKPGGEIYMLFPSELSASLPSRRGGLNYFDDGTHQGRPPSFHEIVATMRGFEFIVSAPEYRPLADMLLGLYNEHESVESGWIKPGTWALHGFEAIIWAARCRT